MSVGIPLFDINQLNDEQRQKFQTVDNEMKSRRDSYLQYKLNLPLQTKLNKEEEENEWCYELHRFLRAKKWNVAHTIKSLLEMVQWRIDNEVDSILEHEPTIKRMELLRKVVPSIYHGYTKADRPIYIEKSGLIHVDKIINMFTPEELLQCHIYSLEYNCKLARDRSRQLGRHIETFTMVSDLHGCKLSITKVFHLYRQALYVDENYYPERLGQMIVVNPPRIFPALWSLVKHWIDPVTRTKIMVVKRGPETATTLLQHIESGQLPKEYGGNCSSCSNYPNCVPVHDWGSQSKVNEEEDDEKEALDPAIS